MKKIILSVTGVIMLSTLFGTAASAQHYVQKGETMSKIAAEYKMSVSDLISLNPHIKNPNVIHPNDYIIVRTRSERQKDLVDYARSLQDVTAYSYGSNNFPYEADCSSFTQGVYKKFGIDLPRTSRQQATYGEPVRFNELIIGDLMFFSTRKDKVINHVGIYMGDGYWISALNSKKDVEILSSWGSWTQENFLWGQRVKF